MEGDARIRQVAKQEHVKFIEHVEDRRPIKSWLADIYLVAAANAFSNILLLTRSVSISSLGAAFDIGPGFEIADSQLR